MEIYHVVGDYIGFCNTITRTIIIIIIIITIIMITIIIIILLLLLLLLSAVLLNAFRIVSKVLVGR